MDGRDSHASALLILCSWTRWGTGLTCLLLLWVSLCGAERLSSPTWPALWFPVTTWVSSDSFISRLTRSTWSEHATHRRKDSSGKVALSSRASLHSQVPMSPALLFKLATKLGVPWTFSRLLARLLDLRRIPCLPLRFIIRIHTSSRMKRRRSVGACRSPCRSLCHCGLGMCHPQSTWTCSPFQKLREPHCWEDVIEASWRRHAWFSHWLSGMEVSLPGGRGARLMAPTL